jgi:hypothetical protein
MMRRVLGTVPPPTTALLTGSCLFTQPEATSVTDGVILARRVVDDGNNEAYVIVERWHRSGVANASEERQG